MKKKRQYRRRSTLEGSIDFEHDLSPMLGVTNTSSTTHEFFFKFWSILHILNPTPAFSSTSLALVPTRLADWGKVALPTTSAI
jgi:hypothetical protein